MEYRPFSPTKVDVSVIGEGRWYIEQSERKKSVSALRRSVELEMNHLDMAELYGNGEAERMIREAVGEMRDNIFLVSKVMPGHMSRRSGAAPIHDR